jgi:hypothetical protein
MEYGFISGGGKEWYSRTLRLLDTGDRIWVNIPGQGFVGVGRVTGQAEQAKDFLVTTPEGRVKLLDIGKGVHYDWQREHASEPDNCEWYVPVRWLQTLPKEKAIRVKGLIGLRNTACKPRQAAWGPIVEQLKELFPDFDKR